MAWGGAYDHLPGFPDWNPGTCLKGSWGPARAAVEQSCFESVPELDGLQLSAEQPWGPS